MGLFSKDTKYLGIDIGSTSLKVCELEKANGKATLSTYGMAILPKQVLLAHSEDAILEIADGLREIIAKAGIKSRKVVAALPGDSVYITEVELPFLEASELESRIRFEAEKRFPQALNALALDWEVIEEVVIPQENKKTKLQRILVTAAPRELVNRFGQVFEKAGLELQSLETEPMALVRSLIGDDRSTMLVVDIGSTSTDMCLVDNGFPRISKSIQIGGVDITQAIAKSLRVDVMQAEQFKKDFGITLSGEGSETPEALRDIVDTFVSEIKTILEAFHERRGKTVEKIILTGGSSRLKGLGKYIEHSLNTKVYAGNPWARVITSAQVHDSIKKIGPEFAVAIGLSMRDMY